MKLGSNFELRRVREHGVMTAHCSDKRLACNHTIICFLNSAIEQFNLLIYQDFHDAAL